MQEGDGVWPGYERHPSKAGVGIAAPGVLPLALRTLRRLPLAPPQRGPCFTHGSVSVSAGSRERSMRLRRFAGIVLFLLVALGIFTTIGVPRLVVGFRQDHARMALKVALAPGDGIGTEIMNATLSLFKAAGVHEHLEFLPAEMGRSVFDKGNTKGITDEAVRIVEDCGVVFKGPMETPKGGGGKSINVTLRKLFSTFANFRAFRTLPGVATVYSRAGINLDFSIVRENVEDTYGGVEHRLSIDMIQC